MSIILAMRRVVIILMILLLPLRAWAAGVMGTQMAMSGLHVQTNAASVSSDCPMHGTQTHSADDHSASSDTNACQSCDLCLPIAEADIGQADIPCVARHVWRASTGTVGISATALQGFKPPIS